MDRNSFLQHSAVMSSNMPLRGAMKRSMPEKKIPLILVFLTAATLLVFWQVNHCEFITYDDNVYVTENGPVQNGLTVEGIRWAFTTYHAFNWHPLTWLSHMLDVQLFGLNPRWHHLTSLLFHLANTLLLFLVLHRMTQAPWQSGFVAALFALHPFHVESVAWVAERKDVLSTLFWMLTLGAYLYYVERPGLWRYLAVFVFFALGLMAKPMLVTLPFVLVLLDFWPLMRFERKAITPEIPVEASKAVAAAKRKGKAGKKQALEGAVNAESGEWKARQKATDRSQWAWLWPLLREKIPLFALTAISCIVTYLAQQEGGAVVPVETLPISVRISNAFVSYILYIVKMIWPGGLAVLYPHPLMWPLWQTLGAVVLFVVLSFMVIRWAKRFPYLAVGWLWYVGTLVPVIGLVQVGSHAMADRYTYVPLIGLFILAAWGIPQLLKGWRWRNEALAASSALILVSLVAVTWTQVGYWQNSIKLYDHALSVTRQNWLIYNNRGNVYNKLGNLARAIQDYDWAIQINPKYADAYNNRGNAYNKLGNPTRAIQDYDRAIQIDPKLAQAYNNRGIAYRRLGNPTRAIQDYDRAIQINPKLAQAYNNRGIAYAILGNHDKAVEDRNTAARLGSEDAKNVLRSGKIKGWPES
jgi:tetratricopeptide (TPR) repeat protein